jgi:hypothetical protein
MTDLINSTYLRNQYFCCTCPGNSGDTFLVNTLKISNTNNPNNTEPMIMRLLVNPEIENDNLIKIVEMTNPELRMIDWNWSE